MERFVLSPGESRFTREEFLELLMRRMDHDFSGSFMCALGYAEALEEDIDDDPSLVSEDLSYIKGYMRHASTIARALKVFAFGGAFPLEFNLSETLDNIRLYAYTKSRKDIVVDSPEVTINNYSPLLYTQLWNFVSNALSFYPDNITISAHPYGATQNDIGALGLNAHLYLPGDSFVRVSVTDDACGIKISNLERIFKSGYSGRGSSGIGLALTEDTCRLIHGYATVESQVDEGSTFSLHFPQYRKVI